MMPRRQRRLTTASIAIVAVAYFGTATYLQRRAIAAQSASITPAAAAPARISADELMRVVRELASPKYEGRLAGSSGGRAARAYIAAELKAIGVEPLSPSGYEEPFQFGAVRGAANLTGRVRGTNAAAKVMLVTAHYDHLGIRGGQLYPGADDNASGVAAMLGLARYLQAHPLRRDVIVAAFDAEEADLEGSKAFVAHPPVPLARMAIDVNLDMLSRNDANEIFAAGAYHYPWLAPIVADVQRRSAVKVLAGHDRPVGSAGMVDDWTMQSDHGSFHKAGVPFIYFGVEDHPDYHKPTDTADKIDPRFYRNVVEMILDAVLELDARVDGVR